MFLPLVVFRLCISVAYFVCSFSALFHVFASFLRRRDVRRGCCVRETNTPLHVLCWQSCRVALQEPFLNIPFTYMYIYIYKHSIKNGTVSACQIMVWTQYYLRTHSLARVGFTCTCLYVSFANLNIPTFEPCARSDCKLNEYKRIFAKLIETIDHLCEKSLNESRCLCIPSVAILCVYVSFAQPPRLSLTATHSHFISPPACLAT